MYLTYRTKGALLVVLLALVAFIESLNVYQALSVTNDNKKSIAHSNLIIDYLEKIGCTLTSANILQKSYLLSNKEEWFFQEFKQKVSSLDNETKPDSLYVLFGTENSSKKISELNLMVRQKVDLMDDQMDSVRGVNYNIDTSKLFAPSFLDKKIYGTLLYLKQVQRDKIEVSNREDEKIQNRASVIGIVGFLITIYLLWLMWQLGNKRRKQINDLSLQLQAALNTVEETNKSKSLFLSTVIDEIRLPLNGIIGTSAVLLRSELNEKQRENAIAIRRSGVSLLSVINDILDFSKIESGTLTLENTPFVLKDCINEVFSLIAKDSKHIHIEYDPQLPTLVQGDPSRIRQILINLLANALTVDERGIRLKVYPVKQQGDELEIAFEISDKQSNKPDDLPAFQDEEMIAVPDNTIGGMAIGVSISSRLAKLMGGTLKIESQTENGGLAIYFSVKVKQIREADQIENEDNPDDLHVEVGLAKKFPMRILIVDDNVMSQVLLSSVLLKMGYVVEVARNGSEAEALAIEEKFDLIFMDLYMPVMDGVEATRRIRQYHMKNTFPIIIALTANALYNYEEGEAIGFNDHIIKPYKPKDIERIIRKWGTFKQKNYF